MAELRRLIEGLDHPEAVAWDPRGYLVAGSTSGRLYRAWPEDGDVDTIMQTDTFLGGIALDADGHAYVCDAGARLVRSFDLDARTTSTYSEGAPDHRFIAPNFPVFDGQGNLFVSDSGDWGANNGAILLIRPNRSCSVVSTEPLAFANGLAIDASEEHLYVVESSLPGVARMAIRPDRSLEPRELVVELPHTVPDGLAFTADGDLLISCYRPDVILRFKGRRVTTVAEDWTGLDLAAPTNIAYFSDDLTRLVSANLGGFHLTEVHGCPPGAPLRYPRLVA